MKNFKYNNILFEVRGIVNKGLKIFNRYKNIYKYCDNEKAASIRKPGEYKILLVNPVNLERRHLYGWQMHLQSFQSYFPLIRFL